MTSSREHLADVVDRDLGSQPADMLLSTAAFQDAIVNGANRSSTATDTVVESFNFGAVRMPGD